MKSELQISQDNGDTDGDSIPNDLDKTFDPPYQIDPMGARQQSLNPGAAAIAKANAVTGIRREKLVTATLREQNPDKIVATQRTLRDALGKKLIDVKSQEGRRVDNAVMDEQTRTAKTYEVTGPNVNKAKQVDKEQRILDANPGGVFVRDPITGKLYSVGEPSYRINIE